MSPWKIRKILKFQIFRWKIWKILRISNFSIKKSSKVTNFLLEKGKFSNFSLKISWIKAWKLEFFTEKVRKNRNFHLKNDQKTEKPSFMLKNLNFSQFFFFNLRNLKFRSKFYGKREKIWIFPKKVSKIQIFNWKSTKKLFFCCKIWIFHQKCI